MRHFNPNPCILGTVSGLLKGAGSRVTQRWPAGRHCGPGPRAGGQSAPSTVFGPSSCLLDGGRCSVGGVTRIPLHREWHGDEDSPHPPLLLIHGGGSTIP